MPLVGIQRRAWTATTLLPTFSAADANSLEIVSNIELATSSKPLSGTVRTGSRIATEGASATWLGGSRGWLDKALETTEEGAPGNMESVLPRGVVTFDVDTLGGVPRLWVHPADWRSGAAIVHLHGGWFNFGSAKAYRHLVGHIAARAGARAFIPDYRLAPEHPFPAATDDVLACYRGLAGNGVHRIALTGDSAGGNLALVLASRVTGINATLVGVA